LISQTLGMHCLYIDNINCYHMPDIQHIRMEKIEIIGEQPFKFNNLSLLHVKSSKFEQPSKSNNSSVFEIKKNLLMLSHFLIESFLNCGKNVTPNIDCVTPIIALPLFKYVSLSNAVILLQCVQ